MSQHLRKVYVCFKTHYDIGFTGLARDVVSYYRTEMLAKVVQACQATADRPAGSRFIWTMASWPMSQVLGDSTDVFLRGQAEELVKQRQLVWHALPFTMHTEFFGLEDLIRSFYISRDLSERFGIRPLDAKMTDVPGHTWILPSLLAKAGVKFLHLGANMCVMPPDVPRLFHWEGPDGARVLTFYSKGGYGSELLPPPDWPYPVWLAILQTGDNLGPQDPHIVDEVILRAAEEVPEAEVVIGTMEDFGRAIMDLGLDIPVVRADLADTWIRGIGSAPRNVADVRRMRNQATVLETAQALGEIAGLPRNPEFTVWSRQVFEHLALVGEHTWGIDMKMTILPERAYGKPWADRIYDKAAFAKARISDPGYALSEQSWQEQREYVQNISDLLGKARDGALYRLAGAVSVAEPHLTVVNGLGWERNARLSLGSDIQAGSVLVDPDTAAEYPVNEGPDGSEVLLPGLPALGYHTYLVHPSRLPAPRNESPICRRDGDVLILENQYLLAAVDPGRGMIRRLRHRETGKDWVNPSEVSGFGQYRYDIFSRREIHEYLADYAYNLSDWYINDVGKPGYPDQEHFTDCPTGFAGELDNGPGWGRIRLTGKPGKESSVRYGNARQIQLEIVLRADAPYLDLRYNITGKSATPLLESGHITFPLHVEHPEIRINKTGSVINPFTDIQPGANTDLFCCERWIDVQDGGAGLTIIPLDSPLVSLGEPGILRYKPGKPADKSLLLFNLFNNAYSTNFPQWIEGDLSFRFRLYPHAGGWQKAEVWRHAWETTQQPEWRLAETAVKGLLPRHASLVGANDGFAVLACKPAEDGDGIVIRLQEATGRKRLARLCLNLQDVAVECCDLLERPMRSLPVSRSGGETVMEIDTAPFEVHTLKLKP